MSSLGCNLSAEPSLIQRLTGEQKERLTAVLDAYLSGLESGIPLSREELYAAHPDLALELETYFRSLDDLHHAADGFARRDAPPAGSSSREEEKRLGDFRILREIGRGGMGVVYEAEQISLGRRVALKVLPFAAVLDARQIARFKHEAQAAAQLDHPNIVSVYAVGIERGVHYFAMQMIDGQPLDRALGELRRECEGESVRVEEPEELAREDLQSAPTVDFRPSTSNSFLTLRSASRKEYFRTVAQLGIQAAEALHAAHEQGIVHRDVKPSNLLLDGEGKLWVTDFGLARCRSDATLTRTGEVIGTLRYMSPEQATGQSALVDHRSDIYSLGATLYELLALQPAFPGDDGPALLRRIEQGEPRRLRDLQPQVPVDLETVVLKAMARRREDRYPTAQALAADLACVLEGRATVARPPTLVDRLVRWSRRHQRWMAAAAAMCVCAMLGMAATVFLVTREKLKTEAKNVLIEEISRNAREAVDLLGARVAERLATIPGAQQVRREILQDTLRYYRNFIEQAQDRPDLQCDLALTYSKIGALAGEIGSDAEALAAHENAIALLRPLASRRQSNPEDRRRLAVAQNHRALVLGRLGRTEEARQSFDEAIEMQKDLVARSEDLGRDLSDLVLSYTNLGLLQTQTNDRAEARRSFREAVRLGEQLLTFGPEEPEHLRSLAASLNNLSALDLTEEPQRARELYQRALGYQKKAAAARPSELKYRSDLAITYSNLGAIEARTGTLAEAASAYQQAAEIQEELVRTAPIQRTYQHDLAITLNNLGMTQSRLQQPAEAERSFRQALQRSQVLARQNPQDLDLQSSLGGIYNNLGMVQESQGRDRDAAQSYSQAVEHQQIAQRRAPKVTRYRDFLSKHYYNYGRVLRRLGEPAAAAQAALQRRSLWDDDPERLFAVAEELALATRLLADVPQAKPDAKQCAQEAIDTLRRSIALGGKLPEDTSWTESFAALKNHPEFAQLLKN